MTNQTTSFFLDFSIHRILKISYRDCRRSKKCLRSRNVSISIKWNIEVYESWKLFDNFSKKSSRNDERRTCKAKNERRKRSVAPSLIPSTSKRSFLETIDARETRPLIKLFKWYVGALLKTRRCWSKSLKVCMCVCLFAASIVIN